MVHRPIDPSASSERQEVIDWLAAHNYPALPVAPAQSAWKYHKVAPGNPDQGVWSHCPLTADLEPIPLYTGKNPSYLDRDGTPHLINHRQYQNRLPRERELETWFTHPANGVGTLGGWNNTIWLDFDVKQFPSQEECDAAVLKILERKELQQTFIERSHSGGWRVGVRVKQKPDFTNFSVQTPWQGVSTGGSHVGEALFEGRFTVLAPTIGPSGNPYQSIQRTFPVEVESLESIGIYSTKSKGTGDRGLGKILPLPQSLIPSPQSPGSIPLEMLGSDTSRDILRGSCPTGDRSEALTTAINEWYGWQNWAYNNSIPISGDATTLAHYAGTQLGLDTDRINRILGSIKDPTSCHPAALHCGGEESCWKKIYRLDKVTFAAKCPAHIKDAISTEWGSGSGNGGGLGGKRFACGGFGDGGDGNDGDNSDAKSRHSRKHHSSLANLSNKKLPGGAAGEKMKNLIKDIILQDLPPSELQLAKIQVRTALSGISEREISQLFESLEQELELEESRSDRRSEVDDLLKLGDQSLNMTEFLPADLAEPLTQLALSLNIRPEVCLTSLLVAASSLHKTQTELVLHRGQGFSVPPTIFAGLVSESGQKKSPILKAIIKKPLSVLQREKREAYSTCLAQYEKDIASWDKCKSEERSSKFPQGKPNKPQQRLYYFTNATGEGLLYQFQAHPDKALLALVDELVGLFASQNKYSGGRGSDRQDILSAFDGTGATVLRAAGTKADLDGLLLSICGTIQPEVLKRLMRDCSDPDGQWARFLFVNQPLAAATLADDDGGGFDLTERLLDYYRAIDRLPAREYRLSREAFKRYQPVYNQLERLRVSHPSPGMRAVYSKMEGYIGRLAINLHILHELSSGKTLPDEEIPLQHIDRAIALAKFYIGQVKLIHANCAADLGEMAPHLAKVVELSKRMDATTGNSWIKAKTVQTGYDSRHRPRPDAVRSWFRELEALGIGSTKGSGIRLEYSWKLPDLPIDDSDPPPKKKVEKVDKSGEKWITSPPTQNTKNQDFSEKVEKVDNPTHLNDSGLPTVDLGLKDADKLATLKEPHPTPILNPQSQNVHSLRAARSSSSQLGDSVSDSEAAPDRELLCPEELAFSEEVATSLQSWTQSPQEDDCCKSTQNSLGTTHPSSPLSGCDDGVAPSEAVDTQSTFSPPPASVSTFADGEEPDGNIDKDEATQVTFIVFPLNQRKESRDFPSADAGVQVGWKVVLNTTALHFILAISDSQAGEGTRAKYHQALVTVEELKSPLGLSSLRSESVAVGTFIESASGHEDQGELTRTGTNALPLLALVVSAIQEYCLSQVERSGDLPNLPEAAESKAIAQPQATETGDKVDPFKAGDRVLWTNCPTYCEKLAPFEIMWIDGEYAKLDLFPKLVPLSELLRPD
jgi:hypothetical protein